MRGLKFLVISMGILIVFGTSFLVFTIIQRSGNLAKSSKPEINNSIIEIKAPEKMNLVDVISNNKNITLQF